MMIAALWTLVLSGTRTTPQTLGDERYLLPSLSAEAGAPLGLRPTAVLDTPVRSAMICQSQRPRLSVQLVALAETQTPTPGQTVARVRWNQFLGTRPTAIEVLKDALKPSAVAAKPTAAGKSAMGIKGQNQNYGGSQDIPPASPSLKISQAKVASPEDTLVDLNLSDADISFILKLLSQRSGLNLILASPSQVKITLQVKQISILDAVRHICTVSGLAYLKVGGTFILATDSVLKTAYPAEYGAAHPSDKPLKQPETDEPQIPITTKTYVANHVSGVQLVEALKALYPEKGLTMMSGPAPVMPTIQSSDPSRSTGSSQSVLTHDQGLARVVVIRGPQTLVEEALAVARQLDKARPQVAISVTFTDIADDALKDLGLSWDFGPVNITEAPSGFNFGKFNRGPQSFAGALTALEKTSKSRTLASPNIALLDGERGFVLIGDKLAYPVVTGYSQAGSPIISKEEKNVGIYLQVAANVSDEGSITLSLYPQVSTVTGYLTLNGASYPQISTREAQTTIRVKSGETIVVGGLIRNDDVVNLSKVPILSELPVLGELFKHRKTTKNRSQVLISITPKIINESR